MQIYGTYKCETAQMIYKRKKVTNLKTVREVVQTKEATCIQ